MRNKRLVKTVTAVALSLSMTVPAFAMPGDIKQAEDQDTSAVYDITEQNETNYLQPIEDIYVATGSCNVRSTPNGDVVGSLEEGKEYYVIGYRMDCGWYKVRVSGMEAYVYEKFLAPKEEMISNRPGGAGAPEVEVPEVTEQNENNFLKPIEEIYVATGAGNVRETPNGKILSVLKPGKEYYVIAYRIDCGWYKVKVSGMEAYVYQDFLAPQDEASKDTAPKVEHKFREMDIMMQATANVNMRTEPNGAVVGVLKKGTDIHVVGNLDDVYWYKCEVDGETVYVYDDYLVPDFPQTMEVTHNLNVRSGPATGAQIVSSLKIGDKVKVTGIEDGWYKFKYNDKGDVGYSYGIYMAAIQ